MWISSTQTKKIIITVGDTQQDAAAESGERSHRLWSRDGKQTASKDILKVVPT